MKTLSALAASLGLLCALAGSVATASAGSLGGIAGVVTDAKTGQPLAGVHVKITSPSQAATVTTDSGGHYIVLSLPPDTYTITADKDGYSPQALTNESVEADQTQRYDLELTPSGGDSSGGTIP
jgi:hypothetical protein